MSDRTEHEGLTRRAFFTGLATCVCASCSKQPASSESSRPLRPPGVVDEEKFLSRCIRCGVCESVCPNRAIKTTSALGRVWLAPEMDFESGYCSDGCLKCAEVCPTGAIPPVASKEERGAIAGVAVVDMSLCLFPERSCGICTDVCPHQALRLVSKKGIFSILTDRDHCNGCGLCQFACAVRPVAIKVVRV